MLRDHVLSSVIAIALTVTVSPSFASADLGHGTRLLPPIRYKQLAVFPVVRQGATDAAPGVLTLREALAQRLVTVRERDGGGDVNHVDVRNRSDRPLLLLGGELILGGQQDRIIGKDTVVPPGQRLAVEVFCVEHGRWSGARQFSAVGGLVENKVRLRAKYRGDQGQVWDQVAEKTAALGAASATGTYRQIAAAGASERALKPYRDRISAGLSALPETKQLVGLVAAVNGRVTSVDVFASPSLFAAYRKHLVESIVVSAADVRETAAAARPPTEKEIDGFMRKADDARAVSVTSGAGSRSYEKKSKEVVSSTLELGATPAAAPAPAPATPPLYRSYQANE